MKIFAQLVAIALLGQVAFSSEVLLQVVEVARHGARSPIEILPLNATHVNFNDTLELLEEGFIQHYNIGTDLRTRLVTDQSLLSSTYDFREVYTQATNKLRTQLSAQAQLSGLYPENAWYHPWLPTYAGNDTYQKFVINNVSEADNWVTKMTESNCNLYKEASDHIENNKNQVREYFSNTFASDLEAATSMSVSNETEFDEICEYLFFSQFTDIELNFMPTNFDRNYCMAYEDSYIFEKCYGNALQWKLLSFEFLNQIKEFALFHNGTINSLTDMPYLWKYMNSSSFHYYDLTDPIPKLVLYTSHDEIIGAYFEALDWHQTAGVYPAGALYIDFFYETSENNQVYARMYYKKLRNETSDIIPDDKSSNVMKIEDFNTFIQERINFTGLSNLTQSCSQTYYISESDLYPVDWAIDELLAFYSLPSMSDAFALYSGWMMVVALLSFFA